MIFADEAFSIPIDHIHCRLSGEFQLAAAVEAERKSVWDRLLARHPAAFDGRLLRMAAYGIEDGRLTITAESTCFSAYVATRHPDFAAAHPQAERADPLGLTVVLITADQQVITTKRSLAAEQNPGALYFVGGYAEPATGEEIDLFDEAARELAEEIAVTDIERSRSYAIGLAYDPVFCHPELLLLMASRSTAADILDGAHHAPDRNEAAELFASPLSDILNDDDFLPGAPRTWSFLKAQTFLQHHFRQRHSL
nr:NUDIX hydrolase [Rhizobium sp. BK650]